MLSKCCLLMEGISSYNYNDITLLYVILSDVKRCLWQQSPVDVRHHHADNQGQSSGTVMLGSKFPEK